MMITTIVRQVNAFVLSVLLAMGNIKRAEFAIETQIVHLTIVTKDGSRLVVKVNVNKRYALITKLKMKRNDNTLCIPDNRRLKFDS